MIDVHPPSKAGRARSSNSEAANDDAQPAPARGAAVACVIAPPGSHAPSSALTDVVIVDGHSMVRDALAGFLAQTAPYHVLGTAGGVREALALCETCRPDVVVTELALPDGNGIDLVRRLSTKRHGTRVLILSTFSDDFYASEVLDAGAAGYLMKHQPTADLLAAMGEVAIGRMYVSPLVDGRLRQAGPDAPKGIGLDKLTRREKEIFHRVVRGSPSKEVATALGIALKTVETHRTNISRKLNVRTTAGLIRFAVAHGVDIEAPVTTAQVALTEGNNRTHSS